MMTPTPSHREIGLRKTATSLSSSSADAADAFAQEVLREYAKYLEKRDAIREERRALRRGSLRGEELIQN